MRPWKIVFIIWVFLWIFFLARGLVKGRFEKYKTLYSLNRDEKLAYILGKELNDFLRLCKEKIPASSTYDIVGDLDEHDRFRFVYYLYPRLKSEQPDYILKIYPKDSKYLLERTK